MILALLLLAAGQADDAWPPRVKGAIERYLGRPYSWGAAGLKSFDCSGFVWRVMWDSGIAVKRTTARKFWFSLPPVPESRRWQPGNLVFFDNLTHVGIVNGPADFFHAISKRGTHLSKFDPFWRPKIGGVRTMPRPGN